MSQIADFDQLMADVTAGSEEAIWQLAETYTPYIIRAVRVSLSPRLRQKLDSQDFAQTLWASILLKRSDLSRLKTPEQLIAYLARATKYKVIDKTRHFKTQKHNIDREERLEDQPRDIRNPTNDGRAFLSPEPTPSTSVSLRERWKQILADTPERDREILQLRLKGCNFSDISIKLQINAATARRAMQRIIAQLTD